MTGHQRYENNRDVFIYERGKMSRIGHSVFQKYNGAPSPGNKKGDSVSMFEKVVSRVDGRSLL